MSKALKSLVLLAVCLLSFACSIFDTPSTEMRVSVSALDSREGAVFASGLAACGFCHGTLASPGTPMQGGRKIRIGEDEFRAPGVNPASWNSEDFIKFFREGVIPGRERRVSIVHTGFEWLSDKDLFALVGYLESLPAGTQEQQDSGDSWFSLPSFSLSSDNRVKGAVPSIPSSKSLAHGSYLLTNVARCQFCHSGEEGFFSEPSAWGGGKTVEIASQSIEVPSLERFVAKEGRAALESYLRDSRLPSGESANSELCPTAFYGTASDKQIRNLALALEEEIRSQ